VAYRSAIRALAAIAANSAFFNQAVNRANLI
jgi:hypothetical protein